MLAVVLEVEVEAGVGRYRVLSAKRKKRRNDAARDKGRAATRMREASAVEPGRLLNGTETSPRRARAAIS
jgi:hypothetical protein